MLLGSIFSQELLVNFTEFNFNTQILSGIQTQGYRTATPIQIKAIPAILQGRDVVGLAQTGTGKTAAYALPLLQQLTEGPPSQLRALILSPTRDLADQICVAINHFGRQTHLRCATIYGGKINYTRQYQLLTGGVDIIVACPGRLLDLLQGKKNNFLHQVKHLVLDEADHLFDHGFRDAIYHILKHLPPRRQNLLFSATMSADIRLLIDKVLHRPVRIQIGDPKPAVTITQTLFPVSEALKVNLLETILQNHSIHSAIIFTRTKHRAQCLAEHLRYLGYKATSFQGNLSQSRRKTALGKFRQGELKFLVATDVAARGIDIDHLSHVINFDMPNTAIEYTHRIGRTGRADKLGKAFSLITKNDKRKIQSIEHLQKKRLEECIIAEFDYHAKINPPMEPMNAYRRKPLSYPHSPSTSRKKIAPPRHSTLRSKKKNS
ncbi:DEAD/DEAH box helicase [Rickettsiella grylli]|uniref:DEAD/DEAH box helicase n=1 Tax=Rickettsiella grylli TaxID=59196 RepID=UPI000ACDE92D|nr:DEAD/DEAH box helicase [Rickettsiella grylli]